MIVFVKPYELKRVRLPDGNVIPKEGINIELSPFIQRRIKDNDLQIVEQKIQKKKKK